MSLRLTLLEMPSQCFTMLGTFRGPCTGSRTPQVFRADSCGRLKNAKATDDRLDKDFPFNDLYDWNAVSHA
jgi:hypothetical protein